MAFAGAWLYRGYNGFAGPLYALQPLLSLSDVAFSTPSHFERHGAFSRFRLCTQAEKSCHQIAGFSLEDRSMSRNNLFWNTQHPIVRLVWSLPLNAPLRPVVTRAGIKSHVFVRTSAILQIQVKRICS